MRNGNRREFLADVGRGMLMASVGPALAYDLGLSSAFADEGAQALSFGKMEPLVALMQETPAAKLLPVLVDKLRAGTELRTLVAAAALANARTFGGQDYIGFHAFMALAPAYEMAQELPAAGRPLPILKVLYRNSDRMQAFGGRSKEVLHPVEPETLPQGRDGGELLRDATRQADFDKAERTFAALARQPADEAFNALQYAIQDMMDVHRVVLSWRAWVMLDLAGKEQAHALLRQSVRYCAQAEQFVCKASTPEQKGHVERMTRVRKVLPRLLDQYHLVGRPLGNRSAEDAWLERMGETILTAEPEQAAEAVAAALAEGMSVESLADAMAVAANQLVLRDPGRTHAYAGKPLGSVHGDSVGVHASDAANAWRNIAKVSNPRNTVASLIVGAYHTAGQCKNLHKQPYPLAEHVEKLTAKDAGELLSQTEAAIKDKDQANACALVHRYGALGHPARPVFDLLLRYAVSEDGALHAEKYYRTVTEEFALARPAFRWRQLAALARVTASEYGTTAAGYDEARRLLKV